MQYALQNAAPKPTLQHLVRDIEGKRVKLITFSGVVDGRRTAARHRRAQRTPEQPGAPVGFYVPEAFGIPVAEATVVVGGHADPDRHRWPHADGDGVRAQRHHGSTRGIRAVARRWLAISQLHMPQQRFRARRALPRHDPAPTASRGGNSPCAIVDNRNACSCTCSCSRTCTCSRTRSEPAPTEM